MTPPSSPSIENLIISSYMAYAFTLSWEWDVLLVFAVHSNRPVCRDILITFKLQIYNAVEEFGKVACNLRQDTRRDKSTSYWRSILGIERWLNEFTKLSLYHHRVALKCFFSFQIKIISSISESEMTLVEK